MSAGKLRPRVLAGGSATLLAAAVVANFAQLSARLVISPLLPDVIDTFDVSKATVGLALTLMWAAYAVTQSPSGRLADRYGERRVVLVALAALVAGSLLLSAAPTFALFAAAAMTVGVAAGLYFPAAVSLLTARFEDRGTVLGFHVAGASLGGLVAPPVATFVALRHGWRAGLLVGAGIAAVALVWFSLAVEPDPPATEGAPESEPERDAVDLGLVVSLFRRPAVAYTTFLAAVGSFAFQSFASFFPTFLVEYHGIAPQVAGITFSAIFFVGTLALPVLGRLSEAVGRGGGVAVAFTGSSVGYVALLLDGGTGTLVVATLLVGVGLGFGGVMQARFMDLLAAGERGTAFGLIRTVYVLVAALGSVVTGTLADWWGWATAFGLVAALLVLAVVSLGAVAGSRRLP